MTMNFLGRVCVSAILAFVFVVAAQASSDQFSLYAVALSNNGPNLLRQTVLVNTYDGVMTTITTNGEIPSSSWPTPRVSALDQKRGIYYFSDDTTDTAVIHSADIKNKNVLPDIHLNYSYVDNFHYDNVNDRLLLFHSAEGSAPTLAAYKNGKIQDLWPSNLKLLSVGLDEANHLLIMVTNATGSQTHAITTLDLNTMKTKSFKLSAPCSEFLYLSRLLWSPATQRAYTLVPNPNLNSPGIVEINPTNGHCELNPLQMFSGYLGDWALDPSKNEIYTMQAINNGYVLVTYDIHLKYVHLPSVMLPLGAKTLNFAIGPTYN